VSDVVLSAPVVACVSVLAKLITEGFLSMPVLSAHDSRFIGFIDLLDIVWFTL